MQAVHKRKEGRHFVKGFIEPDVAKVMHEIPARSPSSPFALQHLESFWEVLAVVFVKLAQ